jgi:cell shape-determining protein MreC
MDDVVEKLRQIQQLWTQLGPLKTNSAEYEAIAKKIRILSAEYQALTEARIKRDNSK